MQYCDVEEWMIESSGGEHKIGLEKRDAEKSVTVQMLQRALVHLDGRNPRQVNRLRIRESAEGGWPHLLV